MTREAALFVLSEECLVEVLGRIGPADRRITMAPLTARRGEDTPASMRDRVAAHVRDEGRVVTDLTGRSPATGATGPVAEPFDAVVELAAAACAAAGSVRGPAVAVAGTTAGHYLLEAAVLRAFLAHDVAMHLGSRACPLTEELARGLWEATAPDAEAWRASGLFGEPLLPYPADVSWRDRFLMSAGRDPHPLVPH